MNDPRELLPRLKQLRADLDVMTVVADEGPTTILNYSDGSSYALHEQRGWSKAKDAALLGWALDQLEAMDAEFELELRDDGYEFTPMIFGQGTVGEGVTVQEAILNALVGTLERLQPRKGP